MSDQRVRRLAFRAAILSLFVCCSSANSFRGNTGGGADWLDERRDPLQLWIDEKQVKIVLKYEMQIYVVKNGFVMQHLLDPNFEQYLPTIPSEVSSVNFTWMAGDRPYHYRFEGLKSFDHNILNDPVISIPTSGWVPRKASVFQVLIDCVRNVTGTTSFTFGLTIVNGHTDTSLEGMPIRLKLKKQCDDREPDPECDRKCGNGKCNQDKICVCPSGFLGKYCESALCYPACQNGGTCVAPGVCACSPGFNGLHCEGGICTEKCENRGKCTQKDKCSCPKGYYGTRCQYSECLMPCVNGGRCKGVNKCRCRRGFTGNQCQIARVGCNKKDKSSCPNRGQKKKKPKRKFV